MSTCPMSFGKTAHEIDLGCGGCLEDNRGNISISGNHAAINPWMWESSRRIEDRHATLRALYKPLVPPFLLSPPASMRKWGLLEKFAAYVDEQCPLSHPLITFWKAWLFKDTAVATHASCQWKHHSMTSKEALCTLIVWPKSIVTSSHGSDRAFWYLTLGRCLSYTFQRASNTQKLSACSYDCTKATWTPGHARCWTWSGKARKTLFMPPVYFEDGRCSDHADNSQTRSIDKLLKSNSNRKASKHVSRLYVLLGCI